MAKRSRREFLKSASAAVSLLGLPPAIARALQIPAAPGFRSLKDVQHVIILMQENRSFDHYFGSLRGVRGFLDRHPVPMSEQRSVWQQSDGEREVPPFHLNSKTTSALKVASTPHSFADAQAAWNQGRFGSWAKIKTPLSMGHYRREDIPFQFALAEAFTICDAYHASLTTGTDPNRIVYWSGANADPERSRRGEACTDAHSEPNNLRSWVTGALPEPGYTYQGSAFTWSTIPEVLEQAGISWRVYQDPNDNWTGAMHGGLAFEAFRNCKPGSPLYEKAMRHWSLETLADDVKNARLPQVSWVLPSQAASEHPSGSSPMQGAEFTARILDAITANPDVWGRSAIFLTFDENDGLFDHVPPPAPPSLNPDGTWAGKSTVSLNGMYFSDPERKYRHAADPVTSTIRPWGLGPRVPMYVISPWSKGGWVNSQVFDHTSVGQFLERRFGITIPAISPWRRAVCGDLSSCFDFANTPAVVFPPLPRIEKAAESAAAEKRKPAPEPPRAADALFQEPGVRPSRSLPYRLEVDASLDGRQLELRFRNAGKVGAVFHVYDRQHLDLIPRRYTVEAGKALSDQWLLCDEESVHHLWIYGPNGFIREIKADVREAGAVSVRVTADVARQNLLVRASNNSAADATLELVSSYDPRTRSTLVAKQGGKVERGLTTRATRGWYDLTVIAPGIEWRFAGRLDGPGADSVSDPLV